MSEINAAIGGTGSDLGDKILFSPDAVHPFPDSGHQQILSQRSEKIDNPQRFDDRA